MAKIHPTAIVDSGARLADDVEIGAYTLVGPEVEIGAGTWVGPHVVLTGQTRIGAGNRIYQFCSIGEAPQDKKYAGEPTRLEIGDGNTLREYCTFNRGTVQDAGVTRMGHRNWIMAYVHVAHDCQVGNDIIIANSTQLAGHVHIGDHVILGGFTGVHQYCRVGAHSMTGVGTVLLQDLPAYVMASGDPAAPHGINSEGLKRRGFSSQAIEDIRRAYKTLYRSGLGFEEAKKEIAARAESSPELKILSDSLALVTRGVIR